MQSKVLLQRVKKLEKKLLKEKTIFVFFEEPTDAQLAKIPEGADVIVYTGEDEIED
ncbi:MAG: hypothetical protein ACOX4U_02855 [Anaerovoracaceae bacterium]|jgi:hypothetical protein